MELFYEGKNRQHLVALPLFNMITHGTRLSAYIICIFRTKADYRVLYSSSVGFNQKTGARSKAVLFIEKSLYI